MAKRPTIEQIETAIRWLDCNEGDPDGERGDCVAVAIYLESLLERREAKEAGISLKYLRKLRSGEIS